MLNAAFIQNGEACGEEPVSSRSYFHRDRTGNAEIGKRFTAEHAEFAGNLAQVKSDFLTRRAQRSLQ
jgi:hypothetical protein